MGIDIMDIVCLVNKRLQEGASTAQIEKDMKLGKDTLRKRLNRAHYKYNSHSRQYEPTYNTNVTSDVITHKTIAITQKDNIGVTEHVISPCNTTLTQDVITLTEDEIMVLKSIVKSYNLNNKKNNFNGEIVIRSIRTYKTVLDNFSQFCKLNNLSQKDALSMALSEFMNK